MDILLMDFAQKGRYVARLTKQLLKWLAHTSSRMCD